VNDFSVDLGAEGRRAGEILFDRASAGGVIPRLRDPLCLPQSLRS
jgi:hypothetical protein